MDYLSFTSMLYPWTWLSRDKEPWTHPADNIHNNLMISSTDYLLSTLVSKDHHFFLQLPKHLSTINHDGRWEVFPPGSLPLPTASFYVSYLLAPKDWHAQAHVCMSTHTHTHTLAHSHNSNGREFLVYLMTFFNTSYLKWRIGTSQEPTLHVSPYQHLSLRVPEVETILKHWWMHRKVTS